MGSRTVNGAYRTETGAKRGARAAVARDFPVEHKRFRLYLESRLGRGEFWGWCIEGSCVDEEIAEKGTVDGFQVNFVSEYFV
jgi:hypothetical protein